MKEIAIYGIGATYIIGAIAAFGFIWNQTPCREQSPLGADYDYASCMERKTMHALPGSMFWPLTLSVQLQRKGGAQ
jgi:hypothetical protein